MLNTEQVRAMLRAQSGTVSVADLGLVHEGKMGYVVCKTSIGIEHVQGMYYVWLQVVHQKNRAGRTTKIVRWPYSRTSATELGPVLADITVIENASTGAPLGDSRGWFARGLDRLIGQEHVGDYQLTSPLAPEPLYGATVSANIARMGGQLEVSIDEVRPSVGAIRARFPQAACANIRLALTQFAAGQANHATAYRSAQ